MTTKRKVMLVAGEASGDNHATKLVRALREAQSGTEFEFFGAAGPKMRAEGVEAVVESDGLSVVGLAEIAGALPMFARTYRSLARAASARKPEIAVLIDFPDFNLKFARALKRKGIKVVYYVSPQLWAWRKYRLSSVKRNVDLMLTILPFEKEWYRKHGFEKVEYVGSPLAREVHTTHDKAAFCSDNALDPEKPIIALLPGSREKEIARILPIMLAATRAIKQRRDEIQFLIALSSENSAFVARNIPSKMTGDTAARFPKVVINQTYDALNAADAAAVTSGTATLEAGILNTPLVVVYKTSSMNYGLLEPMIDVPHYGLINLIADKRLATELIQNEFTAEAVADELLRLLEPDVNQAMRAELKIAADSLGHGGASKRAAEAILRLIGER
jgi:lipid-A-disaccharide synthase